jgi:hypothetical protein
VWKLCDHRRAEKKAFEETAREMTKLPVRALLAAVVFAVTPVVLRRGDPLGCSAEIRKIRLGYVIQCRNYW